VVRRRRSRAEAAALVAEFETSGLSRQEFCRQRGLAVGTLDKYRRRLQGGLRSGAGPMIPVEVAPSPKREASGDADEGSPFVVGLRSGRRIEVRRGFDAGTLERLLIVLDRA
jgi:transposase-like protein